MKLFNILLTAILMTQCVTRSDEKREPSSQAISTALEAYSWGGWLTENGRVFDLNELTTLYGLSADWACETLKSKIVKVRQKLESYKPGNWDEHRSILFIFYGIIPMSRGMSNVSQPKVIEEGAGWKVAIEGIQTIGVQWNVKRYNISYHFLIIKDRGKFRVKDVIIAESGFRRTLCQWLDDVVND